MVCPVVIDSLGAKLKLSWPHQAVKTRLAEPIRTRAVSAWLEEVWPRTCGCSNHARLSRERSAGEAPAKRRRSAEETNVPECGL
jgi:hypothetical protein